MEEEWINLQSFMAEQINFTDNFKCVEAIGGIDVSFKGEFGVGVLVILSFPSLELLYSTHCSMHTLVPYKSGFLGFREMPFAKKLMEQSKEFLIKPSIYFIDGNGFYHERKCGFASQFGIEFDVSSVGIGKSFYCLDGLELPAHVPTEKKAVFLKGVSGSTWCAAVYNGKSKHPTFVSVGHKISLESAVKYAADAMIFKVPEPIRQADKISRALLDQLSIN